MVKTSGIPNAILPVTRNVFMPYKSLYLRTNRKTI